MVRVFNYRFYQKILTKQMHTFTCRHKPFLYSVIFNQICLAWRCAHLLLYLLWVYCILRSPHLSFGSQALPTEYDATFLCSVHCLFSTCLLCNVTRPRYWHQCLYDVWSQAGRSWTLDMVQMGTTGICRVSLLPTLRTVSGNSLFKSIVGGETFFALR